MADLQEQLQAILGDPTAMGQIAALARSLTGTPPAPPPEPEPEAQQVDFVPVEPAGQEDAPSQDAAAAGPDLSALLGSLAGAGAPDIDPKLLSLGLRLFAEYSTQDDAKLALLSSLKPFLSAQRLEKMEKAERIARLARVARVAIRLFKEEGASDV